MEVPRRLTLISTKWQNILTNGQNALTKNKYPLTKRDYFYNVYIKRLLLQKAPGNGISGLFYAVKKSHL